MRPYGQHVRTAEEALGEIASVAASAHRLKDLVYCIRYAYGKVREAGFSGGQAEANLTALFFFSEGADSLDALKEKCADLCKAEEAAK